MKNYDGFNASNFGKLTGHFACCTAYTIFPQRKVEGEHRCEKLDYTDIGLIQFPDETCFILQHAKADEVPFKLWDQVKVAVKKRGIYFKSVGEALKWLEGRIDRI